MIDFNCKAIADTRERRGLTQTDLAERMNTHRQVVNAIETGANIPNVRTLLRIFNALDVADTRPFFPYRDPIIFRKFKP